MLLLCFATDVSQRNADLQNGDNYVKRRSSQSSLMSIEAHQGCEARGKSGKEENGQGAQNEAQEAQEISINKIQELN